ncbi:MAG: hypothetical protein ACK4KT_10115 [Thermaurantimonas sp.]
MKTNDAIGWIALVIFSVVLQVTVLDHIKLSGYINPHLLPGVLAMCKLMFNRYIHLIFSFLVGLVIDVWNSTGGLYASALSMVSFLPVQNVLGMSVLSDFKSIRSGSVEINRYLIYLSTVYFSFFLWLYVLDNFGFRNFFTILSKVFYSSLVSISLVFLSDVILSDNAKSKKFR